MQNDAERTYLSSKEYLEQMCELYPDKPFLYGSSKLLLGFLLGCIGGFLASYTIDLFHKDKWSDPEFWDIVFRILLIIGILFFVVVCIRFTIDGITSLVKKFKRNTEDGSFYIRNGGYTNKPSKSDKIFGRKITPIDSIEDIRSLRGCVLLNGFIVENTKYKIESEYLSTGDKSVVESNREYVTILKGKFKGSLISAYIRTSDKDSAFNLSTVCKGTDLCLMGELNEAGSIEIEWYDKAIRPF